MASLLQHSDPKVRAAANDALTSAGATSLASEKARRKYKFDGKVLGGCLSKCRRAQTSVMAGRGKICVGI